ncbi:(d)CMP kinase [Lihuaxuella thermophila]|uniref:Cytidylate kinase n=1 Tax=Lihuaxuella thermophila TaxID=1173111 RepID=A0A1H8F6G6_9BACL|nr:(d)CMP kinase [Lihuaxuella thermophila]SEN27413.1 cytidylate kinase [Lihuaxuella thermophila]
MKRFLVAIDGPAGAGKSTVARQVAERLGLTYVDTGAMYRALAWKALRDGVDMEDEEAVAHLAESITFTLEPNGIRVNGIPLKDEIRTPQVSELASAVATMPKVRKILVNKQQEIAASQSVVMDGRDIGTHVLPNADVKIFLTASIDERARRRYKELTAKGIPADLEALQEQIRRRDENDRNRAYAPLRQAEDAILVDTTNQSVQEVIEVILQHCRNKLGGEE